MSLVEKSINDVEKQILNTIQQVKYGTVEIVIHEGKVVQVEKTEKLRFANQVK